MGIGDYNLHDEKYEEDSARQDAAENLSGAIFLTLQYSDDASSVVEDKTTMDELRDQMLEELPEALDFMKAIMLQKAGKATLDMFQAKADEWMDKKLAGMAEAELDRRGG